MLFRSRPVRGLDRRVREAARLGFREAIVPAAAGLPERVDELRVVPVRTVREALAHAFPGSLPASARGPVAVGR